MAWQTKRVAKFLTYKIIIRLNIKIENINFNKKINYKK